MIDVDIEGLLFKTYILREGGGVLATVHPGWSNKIAVKMRSEKLTYCQRYNSEGLVVALKRGEQTIINAVFPSTSETSFRFGNLEIKVDASPYSNRGQVFENGREIGAIERYSRSCRLDIPPAYADILKVMIFLVALNVWS